MTKIREAKKREKWVAKAKGKVWDMRLRWLGKTVAALFVVGFVAYAALQATGTARVSATLPNGATFSLEHADQPSVAAVIGLDGSRRASLKDINVIGLGDRPALSARNSEDLSVQRLTAKR